MPKKTQHIGGKRSNLISTAIILFVSGSAFLAGYLQTEFQEESANLRKEAILHQNISSALKDTLFRINNDDFDFAQKGFDYQALAEHQIIDYLNVAPTLTAEETQSFFDRISYNYWYMEWNFEQSRSYRLYSHFELEENDEPYLLDIYPEFDYDAEITKERYFSYLSPIIVQDAEDFLIISLIDTPVIPSGSPDIISELVNNYYMPFEIITVDTGIIVQIIIDIMFEEIEIATDKADQAADTEQVANGIAVGVSITTVASVLALAMSNRQENRRRDQYFSRIRADVLEDETLVIGGTDWLSMIVLFIAALIAVIGLVFPLYSAVF